MVVFLCGIIMGSAITVILIGLISDNKNEVNLTIEDCSKLNK